MFRSITIILLFSACDCAHKLVQSPDPLCNNPCYEGAKELAGVGQCHMGKYECDLENQNPVCKDWGDPVVEVCDSFDNDCDGIVDGMTKECNSACASGNSLCTNGQWLKCSARGPVVETCNWIDDDCDGVVDNINKSCYTGPLGTESKGECHVGSSRCVGTAEICYGEKRPSLEICDGLDNDCDGKVDEDIRQNFDLVFIIDNSGSMGGAVYSVAQAVRQFALTYTASNFRFALVRITDSVNDGKVLVDQDLTDVGTFQAKVAVLGLGNGGGAEASWDSIKLVADGTTSLTWTPGSTKVAILFTDEPGQSYLMPPIVELDAAQAAQTFNLRTFVFTLQPYEVDFDDIAIRSGGRVYNDVYASTGQIYSELISIFHAICQ